MEHGRLIPLAAILMIRRTGMTSTLFKILLG